MTVIIKIHNITEESGRWVGLPSCVVELCDLENLTLTNLIALFLTALLQERNNNYGYS